MLKKLLKSNKYLFFANVILLTFCFKLYAEPLDLIVPSKNHDNGSVTDENKLIEGSIELTKEKVGGQIDGISIKELDPIDPSSVGLYKAEGFGLSRNLWQGTNRSYIEALIPLLPENYSSLVLRNLYLRLLLSESSPPPSLNDPVNLLEIRIDKLSRSGYVSQAAMLSELVPKHAVSGRFDKLYIESKLLEGDNLSACDRVERMFDEGNSSSFLLKHFSLCKIFSGDVSSSRLVIDLLHELDPMDKNFFSLVSVLIDGENVDVSGFDSLSPIHLAMIKAAKLKIPDGMTTDVSPTVLMSMAVSPNTSLTTRISAAERAVNLGILGSEQLSSIYSNIVFTEDRVNVVFDGNKLEELDSKALLFQIAKTQVVPEAKAEVLYKASLIAHEEGMHITNYLVNKESYSVIKPNNSLIWFAGDAMSAHLYYGEIENAKKWFKLLDNSNNFKDIDTEKTFLNFWPIFYIIDPEISKISISEWVKKMMSIGNGTNTRQIEVTLSMLQKLNYDISQDIWINLILNSKSEEIFGPPIVFNSNLETAFENGKIGETILYSLLILGKNQNFLTPSYGLQVVEGLNKVRLEEEAKNLAIEVLLSYNKPRIISVKEKDIDNNSLSEKNNY